MEKIKQGEDEYVQYAIFVYAKVVKTDTNIYLHVKLGSWN